MHESFGCDLRAWIENFDAWQGGLSQLLVTGIDLPSLIHPNDLAILFLRL
jgi:hypothetical protein